MDSNENSYFWRCYLASTQWTKSLKSTAVRHPDTCSGYSVKAKTCQENPFGSPLKRNWDNQRGSSGDLQTFQNHRLEEEEDSPEDEGETTIDPDYLKFAMQSRLHQIQRAQERAEQEERLRLIEYKDISQIEHQKRLLPDRQGTSDRWLTLVELYGGRADEVATVESRMQCEFNRFCDQNQPRFWPQLPIKLHFD